MPYIADGTTVHPLPRTFRARLVGRRRDAPPAPVSGTGVPSTFGPWTAFGWLDRHHDHASGSCPEPVVQTLESAALDPVFTMRGWHPCPFCPPALASLGPTTYTTRRGLALALGHACLTVTDEQQNLWVAPTLVLHYIAEHGYLPPGVLRSALQSPRSI